MIEQFDGEDVRITCPICWQKTLKVGFDKKTRPYFKCAMCDTIIFTRSKLALRNLRFVNAIDVSVITRAMSEAERVGVNAGVNAGSVPIGV